MAYLLDTNALKLALKKNDPIFQARWDSVNEDDIWVSIIAVKEEIDGHFKTIKEHEQAHSPQLYEGFDFLHKFIEEMQFYQIFPYDEASERLYQSWGNWAKVVGVNDSRIAACAIVHDLTVVTADKDFEKIIRKAREAGSTLRMEDWTRPA